MSRRLLVMAVTLVAAVVLAAAPATCSESSEAEKLSCKTIFGYSSPLG